VYTFGRPWPPSSVICVDRTTSPTHLFASTEIAVLVYKVLYGLALQYFGPLIYVADLPKPTFPFCYLYNRLAVYPVHS